MQTLIEHLPTLRSLWVVWFFVLFLGMLWFVMRPSKKAYYQSQADIPLRDAAEDGPAARGSR